MRALFLICLASFLTACASAPSVTSSPTAPTGDLKTLTPELQAFVLKPEFESVRLSPDAKYLAVSYMRDGHPTFAIMDRATMKITAAVDLEEGFIIQKTLWATPQRVVVVALYSPGRLSNNDHNYQRIYALNVDGTNKRRIFPEGCAIGRECVVATGSYSRVLSEDIFEGKYIIIQESKNGVNLNTRDILRRVDIFTGDHQIVDNSYLQMGEYEIDNTGSARVMKSIDKQRKYSLFSRDLKSDEWKQITVGAQELDRFGGLGFSKDNRRFYFVNDNAYGFLSLYCAQFDSASQLEKIEPEYLADKSDMLSIKWDEKEKLPLYVDHGWGFANRKYLVDIPLTKTLKELDNAFPGEKVDLVDHVGDEMLLQIRSDVRPPVFYIFDSKSQAVRKLLASNSKVDATKVIPSKHVTIKARDGVVLNAYLYIPPGKGPHPLLINIHGGPFGIAERWGFSGEDQLFASQGYAVMRVNYRGSGDAGREFEKLGYRKLGTTMQADIADAAKWAIAKGYAKKDKICTFGGSYGGYSAVMSAMLYPELFKCAMGWGGVYDWNTLTSQNDAQLWERSLKYWEDRLPKTPEERAKQSPVALAKNLSSHLYLVHGINDVRVPIQQARSLKSELENAGKAFQYREYADVGHWFSDQPRLDDYYARALEYFATQLKP